MKLHRASLRPSRSNTRFTPGSDLHISISLEARSLASLLSVEMFSPSSPPSARKFQKGTPSIFDGLSFDQHILNFILGQEALAREAVLGSPTTVGTGVFATNGSNADSWVGVLPAYNAQDSVPGYQTYGTVTNMSPYSSSRPVPFAGGIGTYYLNYSRGNSVNLGAGNIDGTYQQWDGYTNNTPTPPGQINLTSTDTVSVWQVTGKSKALDLESYANVESMIFDLNVYDFTNDLTLGGLSGSTGYSGFFTISWDPSFSSTMGFHFRGHGIEVFAGGSLTATYTTSSGPVTFTDSSFGWAGWTYTFNFDGMTDPAKPYNDVQYGWFNNIAASELRGGQGEASTLSWEYKVSY